MFHEYKLTLYLCLLALCGSAGVAQVEDVARPEETPDDWQVLIMPYGRAAGIDGRVGIGQHSAPVDVPFKDVLEDLDLAVMLHAEARRGKWSVILDGIYLELSDNAGTPGPLLSLVDVDIGQAVVDAAIGYRLFEHERGWVDVLLGGRYMYLDTELKLTPDLSAAAAVSETVIDEASSLLRSEVQGAVNRQAQGIAEQVAGAGDEIAARAQAAIQEVRTGARERLVEEVVERYGGLIPSDVSLTPAQRRLLKSMREAVAERAQDLIRQRGDELKNNAAGIAQEIRSAAGTRLNDLKRSVSAQARQKIERAEDALEEEIEKGMQAAANADIGHTEQWVDPYVGLRGHVDLTESVFAVFRGDIGGFGVGSDLTWQAFAGVGCRVSDRVFVEAGYRYMDVDYRQGGFSYDMVTSGGGGGLGVSL